MSKKKSKIKQQIEDDLLDLDPHFEDPNYTNWRSEYDWDNYESDNSLENNKKYNKKNKLFKYKEEK